MAIYSAGIDKNQNHSMLAIQGTAGTADTSGTAETIPLGADPTTGAMYVYDLAPAGSLSVGSITVTDIETIGTLKVGTISAMPNVPGGTLGVVTTVGSVTNIGMLHGGTVVTTMGDLSGGTLDLVSAIAAGSIAVTAGTIGAFTADIPGGTIDAVTTVSNVSAGSIAMVAGTVNTGTVKVTNATVDAFTANIPGGTIGLVSALGAGSIAVTAGTIGTVSTIGTVNNVIPGTAAENLGKRYAQAAGSTDVGIAVLGKILSSDSHDSNNNDGNYGRLSLTDFRELRTRDQRAIDLANCNVAADYTALSNDTTGIEVTYNHVFGTAAISFDKVNGSDNTIYGGVSKALGTINVGEIFEAGGFVGCSVYLSSLTNVVNVFLRIGTDANNYNCWTWPVANLTASTWLNLRQPASTPDATRNTGNGWNPLALQYVAFGVEFANEANTLADILFDHVHIVGGRVTATDISTAVTTTINNPNINVQKVGNNIVEVNNGAVSNGVQRVTIASDSTGRIATVGTITSLASLAAGSVAVTAGTTIVTSGSVAMVAGTIGAFTANIPGGTIGLVTTVSNVSAGSIAVVAGTVGTVAAIGQVHNAGTIAGLPNIPGGTLGLVTTVSNLTAGSVAVTAGTVGTVANVAKVHDAGTIAALPNIPGGTIGVVSALSAGSIAVTAGTMIMTNGTVGAGTVAVSAGTITAGTINAGTVKLDGRPARNILTYGTFFGNSGTAISYGTLVPAPGVGTYIWVSDLSITNTNAVTGCGISFGTAYTGTANLFEANLGTTTAIGIQKSFPLPVNGGMSNTDLTCFVSPAGTVNFNVSYFISA